MNPWGAVFIVLAIIALWVGIKGTQSGVWKLITGNALGTAPATQQRTMTQGADTMTRGAVAITKPAQDAAAALGAAISKLWHTKVF